MPFSTYGTAVLAMIVLAGVTGVAVWLHLAPRHAIFVFRHDYVLSVYGAGLNVAGSVFATIAVGIYSNAVKARLVAISGGPEFNAGRWRRFLAPLSFGAAWEEGILTRGFVHYLVLLAVSSGISAALGGLFTFQPAARHFTFTLSAMNFSEIRATVTATPTGSALFANDRATNVADLTGALYRLGNSASTTLINAGFSSLSPSDPMPMTLHYNNLRNLHGSPGSNITHPSFATWSNATCVVNSLYHFNAVLSQDSTSIVYSYGGMCGNISRSYDYPSDVSFTDANMCGSGDGLTNAAEIIRFNGTSRSVVGVTTCSIQTYTTPQNATSYSNGTLIGTGEATLTPLGQDDNMAVGTVLADWGRVSSSGVGNPAWTTFAIGSSGDSGIPQALSTLYSLAAANTLAQINNANNANNILEGTTATISLPALGLATAFSTSKLQYVWMAVLGVCTLFSVGWSIWLCTGRTSTMDLSNPAQVILLTDYAQDENTKITVDKDNRQFKR